MGLNRRSIININENTSKDANKISLSDSQKEAIKIAIANKKENREMDICTLEENKEDIKDVATEKVETVNDMVKTPIKPINEPTDTIEEDTNVVEVAEEKVLVEDINVEEKVAEVQEKEDLNTEKDDIAKIIEEENNKSEEDKKVICLDTGIVYENSKDASTRTGANAGAITRNCKGYTKRAGGKSWQFYNDYLLEK